MAPTDHAEQGKLRNWLAETGGIDGKPHGIYADRLRDPSRLADPSQTASRG